ncbi:MAG: hypothetical protein UY16_C0013G0023 [Candidatus Gottesmanbacteria bacterium GW2011_GWA2_47_9]|uniref:Uncharacterized protein n=1 Tax=Candidatus Gottesmanbacteria bacterium GW2011_GWA2_47_9 TaxID=1618445 RepID=A0A0G1WCS3_9BACT|nr:MAG: hypothetical protein UY16_C0013G0023 [Candidatus Gottesmanbacteria bacterium GW2011_GWA2_47_9]
MWYYVPMNPVRDRVPFRNCIKPVNMINKKWEINNTKHGSPFEFLTGLSLTG